MKLIAALAAIAALAEMGATRETAPENAAAWGNVKRNVREYVSTKVVLRR